MLSPVQKTEFMGVSVDSLTLYLAVPQDKLRSILRECKCVIANPATIVQQLAYLPGRLSSSIFRPFRLGGHYESQGFLIQEAIEKLQWWEENLMAWKGRALA